MVRLGVAGAVHVFRKLLKKTKINFSTCFEGFLICISEKFPKIKQIAAQNVLLLPPVFMRNIWLKWFYTESVLKDRFLGQAVHSFSLERRTQFLVEIR